MIILCQILITAGGMALLFGAGSEQKLHRPGGSRRRHTYRQTHTPCAIKSCHRDLWTLQPHAKLQCISFEWSPRPSPSACYVTALLLAGFLSGNLASGPCNSRLQRYLQISSPVWHLNKITPFAQSKINKLYLICTVMQCPISTLRFKTPQWLAVTSSRVEMQYI